MNKVVYVAAVLAFAVAGPALAQDTLKCDDASMMMMQQQMDAMTDPAMKEKKDMAMQEMTKAKESMTANQTDDCMMHMKNAMDNMKK